MSQIKDMLKLENVQVIDSAQDWEDAVRIAVTPLVKGGYVEERYIDGIIDNAHELGPYFVLVPNLALLHARPEQGVIKKQLALTILRKGVVFKGQQTPTDHASHQPSPNPSEHEHPHAPPTQPESAHPEPHAQHPTCPQH